MNQDCIFCKIVSGEIHSTKVYEDEKCLAFMDINPVSKGHVLVIPKDHYDPITETPDDILHNLISVAKKIFCAQKKVLNADGANITQANGEVAGQIIWHIHFHVIPRFKNTPEPSNWNPGRYDSPEEMETCARMIRGALETGD